VSEPPLRIALLGGVPASLGGGGLELQLRRTWTALERRGHEVFHVAHEQRPRPFDVLHAFSSGPDVHFQLEHWRRSPAPFVVSPVVVVAPGRAEWRQRLGSRLPIPAFGPRMRVEVLARADVAVALTEHEAALLRAWAGGRAPRIVVVPNGVEAAPPADPPDGLPAGYAALVGTVSARKRQAEAVAALGAAGVPPVVAGGFEGTDAERAAFERAVAAAGGRWLGEVDAATARAVARGARALVHLSSAEGQSLAVLEALAEGTPAIVSPLPSNRELAAAHPGHVRLCAGPGELAAALAALPATRGPAPALPSWDDVAARLEDVYRSAGA
jgi:glycosyltransferase involved in cell wall biosynthesis